VTATTPVLTDSKTLKEVVSSLTEHIPIPTQGKCEQKNIFEILIRAATQRDSIENTTKVLKNVPTNSNIRYLQGARSELKCLLYKLHSP
jgi:putative transposase